MPDILPAGEHFGTMLETLSSKHFAVRRMVYDGGMLCPWHGNEQASVVFVESGHCVKQLGSRTVELSRNSGLFLPPERLQRDSFSCSTRFLAAEFTPDFLDRLRESGMKSFTSMNLAGRDAEQLRTQMAWELMNPDPLSGVVLEGLFMSAIGFARRKHQRPGGVPPQWLRQAADLLRDAATRTLTMEGIARSLGIHPAHLSREFKRWFSLTPGEYVRAHRVHLAKQQLRDTGSALAQIAIATGFADQSHLSNLFRRHTGLSPSAYRRLSKSQVGRAHRS